MLAAYNYAQALRKGEGVAPNYIEAARWYRFAAERGDFRACNELGLLLMEGKGVARDLEEGFAWIYPATHESIQSENAFKNAMQLASMLTPAQLERAQIRGREYFQRFMEPNREVVEILKRH